MGGTAAGGAGEVQVLGDYGGRRVGADHGTLGVAVAEGDVEDAALRAAAGAAGAGLAFGGTAAAHHRGRGEARVAVFHRAGRGAGAGGLGDRAAFRVVGVQQALARPALQDRGQFPGEVVGVLDAGVGAEGAGGGHLGGRVTGEEDAAGAVAAGDALGGVPGGLAGDLDVEVGVADGAADVGGDAVVGEVLDGFALFGVPGGVEDPVLAVVDREEGAVRVLAGEVADDEAAVADDVGEAAGAEGDADVVEEVTGAALADAELLADRAAGAVGGDQVVRADGGVLAGLAALDDRRHTVGVGLEGEQFRAEAEVAAEVRGVREEFGFQVVLAAQAPGAGAEAGQAASGVDLLEQPLPRVADERGCLQDAVVVGEGGGGPADVRLGAGHPEEFHGADVVAAPPGVDGGARVPFHQGVPDAQPPQEHRHGEAHQGTADDEDRDAVCTGTRTDAGSGFGSGRGPGGGSGRGAGGGAGRGSGGGAGGAVGSFVHRCSSSVVTDAWLAP